MVVIGLKSTAELFFYLDGVRREPPKLTIGVPNSNSLYHFKQSTVYIGYFKVRSIFPANYQHNCWYFSGTRHLSCVTARDRTRTCDRSFPSVLPSVHACVCNPRYRKRWWHVHILRRHCQCLFTITE